MAATGVRFGVAALLVAAAIAGCGGGGPVKRVSEPAASIQQLTVRPDGQRRLYALRPEPFRELEAWLAGYRELWEQRLDRFGEALEKRRKKGKR